MLNFKFNAKFGVNHILYYLYKPARVLKQSSVIKIMNFSQSKITVDVKFQTLNRCDFLNLIPANVFIFLLFPGCIKLPVSFFIGTF